MSLYDAFCKCTKCCWCINLRTGCIILGMISLILRGLFYIFMKPHLIKHAFGNDTTTLDTTIIILIVIISGGIGAVADILLLLGAIQSKRICIQLYLPMMFIVWIFELLCFIILFVIGYHWSDILDIHVLGAFHIWCWFTAHSYNQEWNTYLPPVVVATSEDL